MGIMTITRGGPFTRADLDTMPDDGRRYELIDGVLIVTPAPSREHQWAHSRLFALLASECPDELMVFAAPFDIELAEDTAMQPDLLVARRGDVLRTESPVIPLLTVEILSPSTRRVDLTLKKARYEAGGTASYWVVDPVELVLTAWDLVDGKYVEVAHVTGEESFTATKPFDVTIVPGRLLD